MIRLNGKTAIVTDVFDRTGADLARRFGVEGAAVVVTYAGDATRAQRVVADIVNCGGRALAIQGDVSKVEDVRRIFRTVADAFGRTDIVVNNASACQSGETERDRSARLDIDIFGTFLMCEEAVGQFGPDGGAIINMTSVCSADGGPARSTHPAAKSVVETLTLGLSFRLEQRGIRIVAIDPGDFRPARPCEPDIIEAILRKVVQLLPLRRSTRTGEAPAFVKSKPLLVSPGWRGW